ncbi:transposase, partial [Thalassobaculum sp.]|uniref:transposase n=1 Tax=Thalassobaculum sp. TaxID=2022740 RepID=UPI0032EE3B3F
TQRGNGRARTFFDDDDYRFYRDRLGAECRAAGVAVWAWVLMPNHVHLILTPSDEDGLRRALAKVHRAHAGRVHARLGRSGHFWQGRFGCVAMDEPHLLAALRYVAGNPVRAGLAARPEDWPWSSVHAQLAGAAGDGVTDTAPVRERYPDFAGLLAAGDAADEFRALRRAESIGRPVGDDEFLGRLEALTGRRLKPGRPGPKPEMSALSPD